MFCIFFLQNLPLKLTIPLCVVLTPILSYYLLLYQAFWGDVAGANQHQGELLHPAVVMGNAPVVAGTLCHSIVMLNILDNKSINVK